jgi:hypothetical protein
MVHYIEPGACGAEGKERWWVAGENERETRREKGAKRKGEVAGKGRRAGG